MATTEPVGYVKMRGTSTTPCPRCESRTIVTDTFWCQQYNSTGRRRRCTVCDLRFHTAEYPIYLEPRRTKANVKAAT
jgi:transcriptional regulator NrdR family protein